MNETALPTVEVTANAPAAPARSLAERAPDLGLSMLAAIQGAMAGVYTALPGIVDAFDPATQTASVKPAIKARALDDLGWSTLELPLLTDVPVQFPGGGGFALTFPVTQGDECLLVFASRCIDSWWQSGGVQEQASIRQHDLSDAFAIVGIRSKPRALSSFCATDPELRADDGSIHIRVQDGGWHILGNVQVQGSITASGDVAGQGTSLHTHTHSDPQGGDTGGPN